MPTTNETDPLPDLTLDQIEAILIPGVLVRVFAPRRASSAANNDVDQTHG